MKRFIKLVFGMLASLAVIASSTVPSFGAEKYGYTVRFLTGSQGSFNKAGVVVYNNDGVSTQADIKMSEDNSVITVRGLEYGSRITFNLSSVTLNNDSKYYAKGIRESGMDNNTISTNSFQVNKDVDYVVGYALFADRVSYTIEYVDNKGNELAPKEIHYGNVGDRPVVAFLYMDGYLPQAYNLTGTLYRDPSENIFRFVYTPLSEIDYVYYGYNDLGYRDRGTTGDGGVYVIEGDGRDGGAGGNNGNGAAAGGNETAQDDGGENAGENGDTLTDDNTDSTSADNAQTGPAEIIDIRDEEAALSSGEGIIGGNSEEAVVKTDVPTARYTGVPTAFKVGIGIAIALILGAAVYILFIKKNIRK